MSMNAIVALDDAEERGDVLAPVVDHLAFRALVAAEEDPPMPTKGSA
jgi:hypothetical protein